MEIYISNKQYEVQVAKSEIEKEKGLQDVESMDDNEGVLFDYTNDPQTEISFWMKDTTIPLDIVFINDKLEVVAVEKGEPLSEELITCVTDEGETIIYVLEVNQNSGIQINDKLRFEEEPETDEDDDSDLDEIEVSDDEFKMYILGPDGNPVHELKGGERIFSRKDTKVLIKLAKKAAKSKSELDYKRLGKRIFKFMSIQDSNEKEYVESPKGEIIDKKEEN